MRHRTKGCQIKREKYIFLSLESCHRPQNRHESYFFPDLHSHIPIRNQVSSENKVYSTRRLRQEEREKRTLVLEKNRTIQECTCSSFLHINLFFITDKKSTRHEINHSIHQKMLIVLSNDDILILCQMRTISSNGINSIFYSFMQIFTCFCIHLYLIGQWFVPTVQIMNV